MYKLVVLTDPESAYGFKLGGVDVIEADSGEDARQKLISLINDDSSGIIAINEDFMAHIDERTRAKIDSIYRPIVVSIPSKTKIIITEERRKYLARLIRRAVGFDIRLREER